MIRYKIISLNKIQLSTLLQAA